MSFLLAVVGFVLFMLFIGLVIIPRVRAGREKLFDAAALLISVGFLTYKLRK